MTDLKILCAFEDKLSKLKQFKSEYKTLKVYMNYPAGNNLQFYGIKTRKTSLKKMKNYKN